MNASPRLFVTVGQQRTVVRLAACAGVGALLAGCGGNPFATGKVDPTSPIVSEVEAAGKMNQPFPKFTEIPEIPKDVRPVRQFGVATARIENAREELERDTAESTWTLNDTVKFQAGAQASAGPDIAPTAQDAAATEALARKLRERATPPPLTR